MSKDFWTWGVMIILTLVCVVWVHHSVANWRPPPPDPQDNQQVEVGQQTPEPDAD